MDSSTQVSDAVVSGSNRIGDACARCNDGLDMTRGFDLYIQARSEVNGDHAPTMVRIRVTRELLHYIEARMEMVSNINLLSVKTNSFPGSDLTTSDDDDCSYWTMVIDDEAFRMQPDEGGPGITTDSVFLEALLSAIESLNRPYEWPALWRAGSLFLSQTDTEALANGAEEAFPEFRAEVTRKHMADSIDAASQSSVTDASIDTSAPVAARRRQTI